MAEEAINGWPWPTPGWTRNRYPISLFFQHLLGHVCQPALHPRPGGLASPWASAKIPVTNVENACAGASTALHLAVTGIRSGAYDVALALGSEKITSPNKAIVAECAYGFCMDVENFESHMKNDG